METGSSQHSARRISRTAFLKDVFLCALGSYGGPEAHYGVFSSILVQKRKYLTEEELTEMIGLYALVPGPSRVAPHILCKPRLRWLRSTGAKLAFAPLAAN